MKHLLAVIYTPICRILDTLHALLFPKSETEIHDYWKTPWKFDDENNPETYLDSETTKGRTRFLLKIAKRFVNKNASFHKTLP
jgi:hypothetical protein